MFPQLCVSVALCSLGLIFLSSLLKTKEHIQQKKADIFQDLSGEIETKFSDIENTFNFNNKENFLREIEEKEETQENLDIKQELNLPLEKETE